jgi:dihydrofolate reductase
MTKVVAIMSMSLDGYVADANDGVTEVFDWYLSGDVEVSTASTRSGMTFHVSPASADHLRGLQAEVCAMLTGRRTFEVADGWGGVHPWDVPAYVVTHHVPDG